MQTETAGRARETEKEFLEYLDARLRAAIKTALVSELPNLAVALDTTRNFVEEVLAEEGSTSTRIALARTRAEIALEIWRERTATRH